MSTDRAVVARTAKTLPHSLEAEQAVLGALMIDYRAWDRVSDRLTDKDFYRRDHQFIFQAMADLAHRAQPFDVVTVSEMLKTGQQLEATGGEGYLFELAQNTPTAANVTAYADIVREKAILRQLISVGVDLVEKAYQVTGHESKDLLDAAEQQVFQIAEQHARDTGPVSISTLLAKATDRMDELYRSGNTLTGVSTGFTDMDRMTAGLQKGDLVIIAGRPSMGKTSFAMNIAENVAIKAKKPVLIFSLEMPGESLTMRMLSSLSRVELSKVLTGKLSDEDWPRISSSVGILAETVLYIDDTAALTPTELRSRARRVAREHNGLGLIVVDYLQLMRVPGHKENRTNEISEISRSLKILAKELNVPVIALSQLNRGLEQRSDRRPVMSDLRECVPGNTLVMLADGRRVPIQDLVGQQPQVLSVDQQGKIVTAFSDKVWCVGKKPVFTVHLASGRTIQGTGKHRLLGAEGWKMIDELQPGDRLAIANHLPEPERVAEWSELRLALLGQMIGDGSYLSHQPMRYTTCSEENSEIVARAAREEFSATVKRQPGRGNWHQLVISGNGNRWHPAGMNQWLRELGIYNQRSHQKHIPEIVFRFSNEKIAVLLRHLWATDGCIYVSANHASVIHYSTNSLRLARDVAALLLRFGIVARTRMVQKKQYRPNYLVIISGSDAQRIFLQEIGAFGPRCIQASALNQQLNSIIANTNVDTLPQNVFDRVRSLMQEQGISHRRMANMRSTAYGGSAHFAFSPSRATLREYAELLNDDVLRAYCNNDLFWDRVVAIEPASEMDVYDLTVPETAAWIADGIISHNSGAIEQDADLIAFIYRDEVYDENSKDKGVAEIIIRKQRNGPIGDFKVTFLGHLTKFENYADVERLEGSFV
jgi:replicative DNA helicase